jgi:hypothetical protein
MGFMDKAKDMLNQHDDKVDQGPGFRVTTSRSTRASTGSRR